MNFNVQVICLLSIVVAVTFSSPVKKKEIPKSRLILEYDWPEPLKNLKRFPHPKSCTHFYHTKHDGSHVVKRCDEGEIFDYRSLRCKEKALAKCWKNLIEKVTSKKGKRHFSCPFPWGLYPDTEDCSQFHECLGGKPYSRKCPAFTLFDKAERTCVNEKEAMCADESDVIGHDSYKCPYKWGFFTHPKDCSKYYECLRKVPSIRTCKRNMLFDNFERKCLPMSSVKCGRRLNPYESTPTTAEQVTSRTSRAEPVSISTKSPISKPEKVITEIPKSKLERITSENRQSESESVTAEHPKTMLEGVTIGIRSYISTENPKTGLGRVSTVDRKTGSEKVSTEDRRTSSGRVSTEYPSSASGRVSSEYPRTGSGRVSTEEPSSASGRVSSVRVSTEEPSSASERVSSEYPRTGSVRVSTEEPSSASGRVSSEYPRTGSVRVSTDEPSSASGRVSSEYPRTGSGRVSTEDPSSASGRVSSEYPRTGSVRVSTEGPSSSGRLS